MSDAASVRPCDTVDGPHGSSHSPTLDCGLRRKDQSKGPMHPRFADPQERFKSFDHPMWPTKCPVRPDELAAAGFYYYGE